MKRFSAWTLVVALLALALAPAPPASAAPTASVTMFDFGFNPASVTLDRDAAGGNSIVFSYPTGFTVHQPKSDPHGGNQLQAEGACLNMANVMGAGQAPRTVQVTITPQCLLAASTNGLFVDTDTIRLRYHCHVHSFMVAEILVDL